MEKEKRSEGSTISRRAFLGVSAGAAAAVTAGYAIKWPKLGSSSTPEDITEGVQTEKWVATSCLNCPTRCAVNVRVVNGKAVRIIGNPKSTYSDGKACPRSHVGLQVLYNPERVETPLRRRGPKGRGQDPQWEPISWEAALNEIRGKLAAISGNPHKLLILQGLNTTSDEDLIRRFAKAYGTLNLVSEEALEAGADREGKRMADGRDNSGYELESTDLTSTKYILSFGANIVESEKPLARNLRMWGKLRRESPNRVKVVVVDPRYSVTAAKADEWIPVNPGTEGILAMALAYVIIAEDLYDEDFIDNWSSGFEAYKTVVLADFSPEDVSERIGVEAEVIRRIAGEFARSKPAVAWSGMGATSWPHGTYASHAIFCLNALVGSIDVPGGIVYQESPPYQDMPAIAGTEPGISFREAANLMLNKAVDVVIGFNSNLIMAVPETDPEANTWDAPLAEGPYYVHVAPSLTEMAGYADIVLPACTYLEEWAYESAPPGSGYAEVKLKQPVVEPLHDSRPIAQTIFDLATHADSPIKGSFVDIGDGPKGFVQFRTAAFWNALETDGVWKGPDYQYRKYDEIFATDSKKFEFRAADLPHVLNVDFVGGSTGYPLKLVTYHPVLDIRNGNQNYPWAQEVFLVMHGYGWDNFVEMNTETARELGIKDRDMVWIASEVGGTARRIKARARVFEGILPGVVAIAAGQGHYSSGEWADDIGVNPNEIIGLDYDAVTGQASLFNTRVKVERA